MKFNKIVLVDYTKMNDESINKLKEYSEDGVEVYDDYPEDEQTIIDRIGDAEAIIVSWHTEITENIIESCLSLKYIGMACSLYDDESANVAVNSARDRGIEVRGIRDYGDPGVAEFIISELIQLLNGYSGKQWKDMPRELTDLKIGIVGLGTTGKLLADCLKPFGTDLYYHSNSRKQDYEEKGLTYLELPELAVNCDVLSFHLPKNTQVMTSEYFQKFGNSKIIINTSLGLPFEPDSFSNWIAQESNFGLFDGDGGKELSEEIKKRDNVIAHDKSAGWSSQTLVRLSEKTLQNLADFCEDR